jgi:transposase
MRGDEDAQADVWSYIPLEQRVPADHPLRPLRTMVDAVLSELSPEFSQLYSRMGRPSIPPEHLLRALLLQVLYSVRSERLLMGNLVSPSRTVTLLAARPSVSAATCCMTV